MYRLIIQAHFDAAHHLPHYKGACARIHGHRWLIRGIWQAGNSELKDGMIADFKELRSALNKEASVYDHQDLNTMIPNPTAEMIALTIFKVLLNYPYGKYLIGIEIEESPGCVVRYSEE